MRKFVESTVGVAAIVAYLLQPCRPVAAASADFIVDGLALGAAVYPESAVYKAYTCRPSREFAGFTWCAHHREKSGRFGPYSSWVTLLHSGSNRVVFITEAIEPAFFAPGDIDREIARISNGFGLPARTLTTRVKLSFADAILATWGNVTLTPLNEAALGALRGGEEIHLGLVADFIGDPHKSAGSGLQVFSLGGGPGFLWGANFDQNGKGRLQITAVDPSLLPKASLEQASPSVASFGSAAFPAVATPDPAQVGKAIVAPPLLTTLPPQGISDSMPVAEKALIDAVSQARRDYVSASNEMQEGGARGARARGICAAIPEREANQWIGNVSAISSNGDGKGVLSVIIAPGVLVQTFNNDFSDMSDHTLIEPSSSLFQRASSLKVGQAVRFSGNFFQSPNDCIEETSLTLEGSVTEPTFIVRFSEVSPLGQGQAGCSAVTDPTERLTCFYNSANPPQVASPSLSPAQTESPPEKAPAPPSAQATVISDGLILATGRFSYSSGYLRQTVSVRNDTPETAGARIECGFLSNGELIATDSTYILKIAPSATGYDTVMTSSDIGADRVECRIAEIIHQ